MISLQQSSPDMNISMESSYKDSSVEDNVENTVFVGNLPNTTQIKELKKLFRVFGPILHARLRGAIRKELKIPKKLAVIKKDFHEDSNHINAYIKFKTMEDCKAALKINGKLFNGHHLRVTLAENSGNFNHKKSIFIGNLAFSIQDDDVWNAFEDCGKVEGVRVIRDSNTGIGKGFGYVNFKSADSVELALRLNGMMILDRPVRVSRVMHDKTNRNVKNKRKNLIPQGKDKDSETKNKPSNLKRKNKSLENTTTKHEFQGQKTKPIHKKFKKKKKFDKKKLRIKQIAEGLHKTK